ncbi:MAG TPA: SDR family NAD(P)-dependent oxidoreductase, partial [Streptosporangiaceae bacterium]
MSVVEALARAHVQGAAVDWAAVLGPAARVDLPTYAFWRQRFWPQAPQASHPAGWDDPATAAEARFWAAVEGGDAESLSETLAIEDPGRLGAVLPALASWRRRERDRSATAGWRYRVTWVPVTESGPATLPGSWLVLAPGADTGQDLVQGCISALTARGAHIIVTAADLDQTALATQLSDALTAVPQDKRVGGVLSLLALDETPAAVSPAVSRGLAGTQALVQALGQAGVSAPLWVITCGAVATGPAGQLISPVQAQVWGLGRVAALEHPDRWGGLIDLPPRWDERVAARLCAVLAGSGEDQIAIRPAGLLARRLARASQPPASAAWVPHGTVLVTGGTGAIGGHVARWVAGRGAPRVVLASRTGPAAPGTARLAADLAGAGSSAEVISADVSERPQLIALLTRIPASGTPLTAVMHAAGTGQATALEHASAAELAAVLTAKAVSAAHLDELTAGLPLEQFVLFSSIAATWGSGGQPGYAAANAFLDALAERRLAQHRPATSVAWGPWGGGGMADQESATQLRRRGLPPMPPPQAVKALADALDGRDGLVTVADVDWSRFSPPFTLRRPSPLLQNLPEVKRALADPGPAGPGGLTAAGTDSALGQRLAGLTPAEQDRMLAGVVRATAAAVLGHPSPDAVEADRAFRDMGFDSLTAVELRNQLNAATGLRLPATLVFDYPTPVTAGRFLRTQLFGVSPGPRQPAAAAELAVAPGEPVAIVAMSCRLPGGVTDPDGLWELVTSGTDAIAGFPADRGWDADDLYDPDPGDAGASYARAGGFVYDATEFDAGFFGISPREALAMDPQQRLLLEVCWEAIERAGIDPAALRGSQTGVFAGAAHSGYSECLDEGAGSEGYLLTGGLTAVISGRVSYALGLEGPAVTVDTACSSALVALHLASQALRAGECDLALAGGVTVMVTPAAFAEFSRHQGLAADGRCKAYSAAADGTGWAEGAAVVVAERLADARRHGHPVLAVIRGSAVNQDGASNGLTAPNGPSQQRVIQAALASARLSAQDVDAVEGHGTGTKLGDPIEAQALIATYGQDRPAGRPLWLGSVKSNIGHTAAAAGAAGVIKMVLALQRQMLPRTLHADEPSPHVDWSAGQVRLLTEPVPWPAGDQPRRAGISAFGISGTNVHMIVEEAPAAGDSLARPAAGSATGPAVAPLVLPGAAPWLVSARTADGLRAQAGRLRQWLAGRPDLETADVAWSLATTRSAFEHRAVLAGRDSGELMAALAAVAAGEPAAGVVTGAARAGEVRVGFVFAGQGSQRAGMGAELHAASPVFAAAFDEACGLLEAQLGLPVADVVLARPGDGEASPAGRADQTVFAQAGLFAVGVGMVALLGACGISPDAVAGHSVGEITAAYAAGVLTLADACTLVATRARLMQGLPGGGSMVAIAAGEAEVTAALAGLDDRVSVAAVNGPSSVVISGDAGAVQAVAEEFGMRGVRVRRLRVSHAFHSSRMDPVLAELGQAAADLPQARPRVPWASGVSGALLPGCPPGYWVRQAREPVRFADAVAALVAEGVSVFLEIGPDGTLSALGPAALPEGSGAAFVPVLRPDMPAAAAVLAALARAHVQGAAMDWAAVLGGRRRVELPTYAFQRQRFWPRVRPVLPVAGGDGAGLAGLVPAGRRRPLREVLPVMASWPRPDRPALDWRYQVAWVRVTEPASAVLPGTWLVIAPVNPPGQAGTDLVRQCARALAEHGAQVVVARVAPGDADRVALAAHIGHALSAAVPGSQPVPEVNGVLSLLALEEGPAAAHPVVAGGLAGTQALLQALGDDGIGARLWVLTRGAVAAGPAETLTRPVQAQAWGLGRVAALECPDRWGGLIDLPSSWDGRVAARLCGVLAGAGEDQVAIRAAGVMARRLVRAPLPSDGSAWVPRGTVLVTGGTGAIGGHVARWVAGRGAPRVVLASRSGPAAPGAARLAAELAEAGSGAEVICCDTAERPRVTALLSRIAASGAPLAGVMHTAGTGQATALEEASAAELATVVSAKAASAAHLDELTADLNLEQFVLFSSIAATWGSGGQPGYAAANAYLDALAEARRSRRQPATSVAWGPWGGGGMTDRASGVQLQRRGLELMDPQLAVQALGQVLDGGEGLVTIADVDWARFTAPFTLRRPSPLIADLPEVQQVLADAAGDDGPRTAAAALERQLAGLSPAEQDRTLVDLVQAEAAAVLGHAAAEAVPAARPFGDLGFNSLTAVELRNRLAEVTGLRLPATLVFDCPTPAAAAQFLRAQVLGLPAADAGQGLAAPALAEPVAIVAMSCRFPGGVTSPEELWELLAAGGDAIGAFPADRGWDVGGWCAADAGVPMSYTQAGGFVADAAEFDAGFFGISPREALAMDPQQRLLLEVCWEAIERAGIDPAGLRGSQTGVFAGASASGYGAAGTGGAEGYLLTGTAASVISGRVAYALGLEGPAVTVDTACSSALVALHLACAAVRSGECEMALAGGVTVMVTPGAFAEFSRQQGLAADGRCKAFSAAADGTGWAEGAGVLVVERLSDARKNGHPVLAIVAGSAMNQDGASNGLTAPNGPSQQRVIRAALAQAGLRADDVDAVEGHGTGTMLGDPIEAQALIAAYGQGRPPERPLWLGSVKSNIGHTQAAAGAAGVIKMVLALQHGVLPATLHAGEPSPHVDWDAGAVRLLTGPVYWPAGGRPRRAGVSAFGISGTNAHVILAEAPAAPGRGQAETGGTAGRAAGPGVLPVTASGVAAWVASARTEVALAAQAGRLAEWVAARPGLDTADVGWSLAATRSEFEHRAVVLGTSRAELTAGLGAVVAGEPAAGVVTGLARAGTPRVVFVFPGQGGQWAGMGRELAASSPVFAARLAECGQALARYVDWDLGEVIAGAAGAPGLEAADVVQPALWAMMVSLAAVWQAAGVRPDAVAGHSQGEIAAACVAGILS